MVKFFSLCKLPQLRITERILKVSKLHEYCTCWELSSRIFLALHLAYDFYKATKGIEAACVHLLVCCEDPNELRRALRITINLKMSLSQITEDVLDSSYGAFEQSISSVAEDQSIGSCLLRINFDSKMLDHSLRIVEDSLL